MDIRFVTKSMHAFLDYPVALLLIAAPFALGLGTGNPLALWASVAVGVAAFVLTVFTDHRLGIVRVLPYRLHLAVDAAVGVLFVLLPTALGLTGIEAAYYWTLGATVLVVVGLHKPEARPLPETA